VIERFTTKGTKSTKKYYPWILLMSWLTPTHEEWNHEGPEEELADPQKQRMSPTRDERRPAQKGRAAAGRWVN
jgi:hypothetical protein